MASRLTGQHGQHVARVEACVKSEHLRKYPELQSSTWYAVAPIFPGVTQRMVNMAGERLTRLSTPRGYVIVKAAHLDFRYAGDEGASPPTSNG